MFEPQRLPSRPTPGTAATRPAARRAPRVFPGAPPPSPGPGELIRVTARGGNAFPVRMVRPRIAVSAAVDPEGGVPPRSPLENFRTEEAASGFLRAVTAVLDLIGESPTGEFILRAIGDMHPLPGNAAATEWSADDNVFRNVDGTPSGINVVIAPRPEEATTHGGYFAAAVQSAHRSSGLGTACFLGMFPTFPMVGISSEPRPEDVMPPDAAVAHEFGHVIALLCGAEVGSAVKAEEWLRLGGRTQTRVDELLTVGALKLRAAALGFGKGEPLPWPEHPKAEEAVAKLLMLAGEFRASGEPEGMVAADAMAAMAAYRRAHAAGQFTEHRYALERGLAARTHYAFDARPGGVRLVTWSLGEPGSAEWVAQLRALSWTGQRRAVIQESAGRYRRPGVGFGPWGPPRDPSTSTAGGPPSA